MSEGTMIVLVVLVSSLTWGDPDLIDAITYWLTDGNLTAYGLKEGE